MWAPRSTSPNVRSSIARSKRQSPGPYRTATSSDETRGRSRATQLGFRDVLSVGTNVALTVYMPALEVCADALAGAVTVLFPIPPPASRTVFRVIAACGLDHVASGSVNGADEPINHPGSLRREYPCANTFAEAWCSPTVAPMDRSVWAVLRSLNVAPSKQQGVPPDQMRLGRVATSNAFAATVMTAVASPTKVLLSRPLVCSPITSLTFHLQGVGRSRWAGRDTTWCSSSTMHSLAHSTRAVRYVC